MTSTCHGHSGQKMHSLHSALPPTHDRSTTLALFSILPLNQMVAQCNAQCNQAQLCTNAPCIHTVVCHSSLSKTGAMGKHLDYLSHLVGPLTKHCIRCIHALGHDSICMPKGAHTHKTKYICIMANRLCLPSALLPVKLPLIQPSSFTQPSNPHLFNANPTELFLSATRPKSF
jgi:hypothetical protein